MIEMVWSTRFRRHRVLRDDREDIRLKIVKYKWNVVKFNGSFAGSTRSEKGGRLYLHRYLTDAKEDEVVTPKDGDYLNVQLANLEIRKRSLVAFLRSHAVNPNGFRGVSERKRDGYWIAQIAQMYIGSYKTVEEAARAFDEHAFKIFGVKINFPDEEVMTHNDTSPTTHIVVT